MESAVPEDEAANPERSIGPYPGIATEIVEKRDEERIRITVIDGYYQFEKEIMRGENKKKDG